ncbi:MAG TPA: polysaccharide biosynthesis/export family protein, partial [Nitrospirales bacterium]|nr:polysaccharide biosynthesis/export family protein [Nitrospirales bacterium]
MRAARVVRPFLTVLILVGSIATLASCSAEKRHPATAAVPTAAATPAATDGSDSQGPIPVFKKVPPEENPALLHPAADEAPAAVEPYRLAIEDVLEISIYGETDLQHVEVPVRPDGMISFTFIGDIGAAGRTVEEIRAEMTTRLAKYLRSPQVTIIA